MNSYIQPGDTVVPCYRAHQPWMATVKRIVGSMALIAITEVEIGQGVVRRCIPPLLSWVKLGGLFNLDHEENADDTIEQRGSKTHNRNY